MKIGIIVAMGKEMRLLKELIQNPATVSINDTEFYTGTIGRHEVVAMQCGIGKVNAAIGTLTMIDSFHPSLVINTGVAGGAGNGAGIMDVVVADGVAYHDVWCGPDTVWGQAARCPHIFQCALPADFVASLDNVKSGLIASGDIFVSKKEEVDHILSIYPQAMAVDMESAAIAQVCHLKNVPFVCVRVISDTPGSGDNIEQYCNFWEDAPARTFGVLSQLLQRL